MIKRKSPISGKTIVEIDDGEIVIYFTWYPAEAMTMTYPGSPGGVEIECLEDVGGVEIDIPADCTYFIEQCEDALERGEYENV
jgi:hypothetical protein